MKICDSSRNVLARGCRSATLAFSILAVTLSSNPATAACFRGVNLAGAEFGSVGGAFGKAYIYPSAKTMSYFATKGFNTVRLPFLWERLQPALGGPLDAAELARLTATVKALKSKGLSVVLDVHNYARYNGQTIGSKQVPVEAFADFWTKLAGAFANDKAVAFGLMNEPHDLKVQAWLQAANAATAAIRAKGANNLVLVPGSFWTGAHSWTQTTADGNNGKTMSGFSDPVNNYAFEVHQYFDQDFSGTHASCSGAAKAIAGLQSFTAWLKANGKRGFLGEFGVGGSPECLAALSQAISVVNSNSDVWTGWTYWAGGDWWPKDYMLSVQPTSSGDRPQLGPLIEPDALSTKACGSAG